MRPLLSDVPVWLCRWQRITRYIPAKSHQSAKELCIMAGLGEPDAICYAGFSASPGMARPKGKTGWKFVTGTSRRAEAALEVYSTLRIDWPIGSILSSVDAERRWQVSDATLRDFLANMGSAIGRLPGAERWILEQVVSAQALSWYHAAQVLNCARELRVLDDSGPDPAKDEKAARAALARHRALRRVTIQTEAYHRERKQLNQGRARRLRKRRSYALAMGRLTSTLDGVLEPGREILAERWHVFLVAQGFPPTEAANQAKRYLRIFVPRM